MTLSDVSIKNPVFAWMLMIGLMLFGAISFARLGISRLPDVDNNVVNISVNLEGASPEIMETDVADVLEDAVIGVEGVKEIRTSCKQGNANISVELTLDRDVDVALQEIQTKVLQAQRSLPKDIDPPIISKSNPEDQPILWMAVTSDRPLPEVMTYVRDQLKDQFQTVPGVGEIFMGGYVDRNLRIWADGAKLSAQELTVDDVIDTVERQHVEVPAGRIENDKSEVNIRFMGEAPAVKTFSELPITSRGGAPVYRTIRLREVAVLEDGLNDVRRLSRFNGEASVGIGIRKQRGSNAVDVAEGVLKRAEYLNTQLPPGYKIQVANNQTRFVKDSISELEHTLILSAVLTALVCFLFLGTWTSTINILLAIPTSILGTFIAIYFFGFTLNTFTLLALSLSIGIVVDDAIMVLENIVRHREMGEGRVEGALLGARQITFAATATTLSIVAIFLPVVFMKGIMGKYFFQFGVVLSTAVVLSLLEALTLTPMRCSQFLQTGEQTNRFSQWINGLYEKLGRIYAWQLDVALRHKWTVLILSLAVFLGSFLMVPLLRKEFVPPMDQSQLFVRLEMPLGTSIQVMDDVTRRCEEVLRARAEVKAVFVAVGGFGGDVNTTAMFTTLKDPKDRPVVSEPLFKGGGSSKPGAGPGGKSADGPPPKTVPRRLNQQEFQQVARRELSKVEPKLRVVVQDLSTRLFSSGRGFPVEFNVRGPDWNVLAKASEDIKRRLIDSGKAVDVDSNYRLGQPEVQVVPDRQAAALRGVSMSSIGNVISAMMGGRKAGKFTEGGHRYDVRVRLKREQRLSPKDIEGLFVRNNRGELVKLSELVRLEERSSLQSINRVNRIRTVSMYGNAAPGYDEQQALSEAVKICKEVLPAGYSMELSGTAQSNKESIDSLLVALILGIVVAYMILGSQFNSFLHPITVLLALPFSFTGAVAALLLMDKLGVRGCSLNMYSSIGLILLMGLVKKNSILLVDFTNQLRTHGMGVEDALRKACPVRLRPILMTSIATMAAAVPAALALGPGAEALRPMAVAVIGGMLVSTVLTLLVVPCAYSLLSHWEKREPHSFEPDMSLKP